MFRISRKNLVCSLLFLAAIIPLTSAWAGKERDHDRARLAVERGEALPLTDILARVRSDLKGEVVGVSFERKHNRWVYEFKVIRAGGILVEVYVDAASAKVLEEERENEH